MLTPFIDSDGWGVKYSLFSEQILNQKADVILVGAGLSNGLLAWFLKKRKPELRILLLEKAGSMASQKTWSFQKSDIQSSFAFIEELVSACWPGYEVRFESYTRRIASTYCSLKPSQLQKSLEVVLGEDFRFNCPVASISEGSVFIESGAEIEADCIIDGRGLGPIDSDRCGYQKFLGLHVKLRNEHNLTMPILMDTKLSQERGYHFMYTLPWSKTELLIEDTYYSESAELDKSESRDIIYSYAKKQGWHIESVLDIESGVLPIPYPAKKDINLQQSSQLSVGMAGGFFHPVTGYSLPDAVRLADKISSLEMVSQSTVQEVLLNYRAEAEKQSRFLHFLNRMMFEAAEPRGRYKIFEHFYRLPESTIENFYRGQLPITDRFRLLFGKPPVSVMSALRCIW